jgi:hypothetical protein
MMLFRRSFIVAGFALTALSAGFCAKADVNVVQYHNHASRDGLYVDPAFTTASAAGLQRDLSFDGTISGNVYAQPLYIEGGPGGKAMIIAVTASNSVYALDALNGTILWRTNVGSVVPSGVLPCGNVVPVGIAGTPIVDLPSRALFFDSMIQNTITGTPSHFIFSLNVDTGDLNPGWPVDVDTTATSGSTVFNSLTQGQRGALAIVGADLYVPYGGLYGDCGTYHGWVVGVPLNDPTQVRAWATTANSGGAWSVGGIASDGVVPFVATGNTRGATAWGGGEAIIRFQPGPAFSGLTADYWAPANWIVLDQDDNDLGASSPLLVDVPGATPSQLIVALGKDGNAYLLNRNNLGGIGAPLAQARVGNAGIAQAAATYQTTQGTYVVLQDQYNTKLTAFRITPTSPPTIANAWSASENGLGSPFVTSTNGTHNVIVWGIGCEGDQRLHGFDGDTGTVVYSGGGINEAMAGTRHMNTAIAARGRVYVATDNKVYAFIAPGQSQPVPPTITSQPSNQMAVEGSSARFQVSASGTPPLSYQWMFNGMPLAGATDAALNLANVQTTQVGSYGVVVTNVSGAITSSLAQLTVFLPPAITMQPINQTVVSGANMTFNVTASGTPPVSYQWFFNETNLVGTGGATLSLSNVQPSQAGRYSVIASSPYGSASSVAATLTVLVSLTIITQPASEIEVAGADASFQVSAAGIPPLSYQWMFDGMPLAGATDAVLNLTNVQTTQAGSYGVVVTNVSGAITSSLARLTVFLPPAITMQPINQTVVSGANMTFEVTASGTPPVSYQWFFNETNLVGTGGATLILSDVQPSQAGRYSVIASSPYGSASSIAATLTVLAPPTIITQPASQIEVAGANASFQVSAAGTPPLSYQWMFNGTNLSGATDTNLSLMSIQSSQAGSYSVVVTNSAGSITSTVAQLTVVAAPSDTNKPTFYATEFDENGLPVVSVTFSKLMNLASISMMGNYSIPGANIIGIVVDTNSAYGRLVQLQLAGEPTSLPLTLTITGITDYSGNVPSSSSVSVTFAGLINADIGDPTIPDPAWPGYMWNERAGAFTVTCEGSDIGGWRDGFNFSYESKTNDFDVVVRQRSFTKSDYNSKGGLMIREDLTPYSRNWNIVNDPALGAGMLALDGSGDGANTIECNCRSTNGINGAVSLSWATGPSAVPNYPNAWLRLKRTGQILTAYWSTNADPSSTWTEEAATDLSTNANGLLPAVVYVGIACTAHVNDPVAASVLKYPYQASFVDYNSAYVAPSNTLQVKPRQTHPWRNSPQTQ